MTQDAKTLHRPLPFPNREQSNASTAEEKLYRGRRAKMSASILVHLRSRTAVHAKPIEIVAITKPNHTKIDRHDREHSSSPETFASQTTSTRVGPLSATRLMSANNTFLCSQGVTSYFALSRKSLAPISTFRHISCTRARI
jgi:hypothetical protein